MSLEKEIYIYIKREGGREKGWVSEKEGTGRDMDGRMEGGTEGGRGFYVRNCVPFATCKIITSQF